MIDTLLTPEVALIIVALITAIPARWGYKKATKTDEQTERAGMATQKTVTTGQVMTTVFEIVERLSEDNTQLREQVAGLLERLDDQGVQFRAQIHKLEEKLDHRDAVIGELRDEVAGFMRRNGFDD